MRKILAYAGLTALAVGARVLLHGVQWPRSPELHVLLEVVAGLFALVLMKMALVRYHSRRADRFLLIGVAFLGTGLLDLCHGLAGSTLLMGGTASAPVAAGTWGWIASRLFLAVFLLVGCAICKGGEEEGGWLDQWLVYAGALALFVGVLSCLAFAPLPPASPDLQRVLELVPGSLFLLMFVAALRKGFWRGGHLDHWLALSLLAGFLGQTLFMAFAGDPSDPSDPLVVAGHAAKILSYLCVLVGLLGDMFGLLRRVDRTAAELAAANAALQAEAQHRSVIEAERNHFFDLSLDLLCIAGMNARFRHLSKAWETVLGWSLEELQTGSYLKFVHPDDREGTVREMQRLRVGGAVVDYENRYATKSGGWRWLSWRSVAVPEKGLVYAVARDISDRKRVEQMKSDFISVVSHELRTPLTSIRGSLGLITGGVAGELPEPARSLVDVATRNSDRLARLIDDILDVEKIESGQMGFRLVPQDLMTLVEQAVEANQTYGQPYRISLCIAESAYVPVRVDADRMQQVLNNLLSNAVKFSPSGGVVEVGVTAENGLARLRVTDRGKGIPPEFQARIFEKFSQADTTSTRQRGGTGLGLSISRAIVDRHGGQIWFETAPGQGTTFFVELPVWRAEPAPARSPHQNPVPALGLGVGESPVGGLGEELRRGVVGEDGDAAAEGGGDLDSGEAVPQA